MPCSAPCHTSSELAGSQPAPASWGALGRGGARRRGEMSPKRAAPPAHTQNSRITRGTWSARLRPPEDRGNIAVATWRGSSVPGPPACLVSAHIGGCRRPGSVPEAPCATPIPNQIPGTLGPGAATSPACASSRPMRSAHAATSSRPPCACAQRMAPLPPVPRVACLTPPLQAAAPTSAGACAGTSATRASMVRVGCGGGACTGRQVCPHTCAPAVPPPPFMLSPALLPPTPTRIMICRQLRSQDGRGVVLRPVSLRRLAGAAAARRAAAAATSPPALPARRCCLYYLAHLFCLQGCVAGPKRAKLRGAHGLPAEPCSDCCVHTWCSPCAVCQEMRVVKT